MATTQVEVVSPAKVLYEGEAEMVVCRTDGGEIAFLADHIPYLGALTPGLVRLVPESGDETKITVAGGFVEVRDNHVIILADRAEMGEVDLEPDDSSGPSSSSDRSGSSGSSGSSDSSGSSGSSDSPAPSAS